MKALLQSLGFDTPDSYVNQVIELFGSHDANRDGLIDFDEFPQLWEQARGPPLKHHTRPRAHALAHRTRNTNRSRHHKRNRTWARSRPIRPGSSRLFPRRGPDCTRGGLISAACRFVRDCSSRALRHLTPWRPHWLALSVRLSHTRRCLRHLLLAARLR